MWFSCPGFFCFRKKTVGASLPKLHEIKGGIYDSDGNIQWHNPLIYNLLFAKGITDNCAENYMFLYDSSEMINISKNKKISNKKKDEQIRELEKILYKKYFDNASLQKTYPLEMNDQVLMISCEINIGASLRRELSMINERVAITSHQDIIDTYKKAIDEITLMLGLPIAGRPIMKI